MQHARATARGRRGPRRRCSSRSTSGVSNVIPAAIRRPPTVRNASRSGPVGAEQLEQAADEHPALRRRPACRGNRPSVAPAALVEVDEGVEVGERVGRVVERDLARRLGAADLAPDLVALLLAERAEVVVDRRALGQRRRPGRRPRARRSTVQPSRDLAAPEGRGQRVGRRVAAAEPAQVDDVPRARVVAGRRRTREVVGERRRRRPAGRAGRGEDRRVVGVVAGAEEDRLGVGRRRASAAARRRGGSSCASSTSPGSTSWRCMSGTIATGAASVRAVGRDDDERLLVGVRAVARPTTPDGRPSGRTGSPRGSRRRGRPRRPARSSRTGDARPATRERPPAGSSRRRPADRGVRRSERRGTRSRA